MSAQLALLGVLLAPVLQAAFVLSLQRPPGLRDVTHIGFALVTASPRSRFALT